MAAGGAKGMQQLPNYETIAQEQEKMGITPEKETWEIMRDHAMSHCFVNGAMGQIYNVFKPQVYEKWGFQPFDDIKLEYLEKMKVMISYGLGDPTSPESHGEFMANFYSEKINTDGKKYENVHPSEIPANSKGGKCLVNAQPGGHEAHFVNFFKGHLVKLLCEM
jgi:hypothetical protein